MSAFRSLAHSVLQFSWLMGLCLISATPLGAQQPYLIPQSELILPAGGKVGTTFEVTVHGTHLAEANKLLFGHPGIKAEWLKPEDMTDPIRPAKGSDTYRDGVQKFKVTIAKDVPLGETDVRILSEAGNSRPLPFLVSALPHQVEEETNDEPALAQVIPLNSVTDGVILTNNDVDYYTFAGNAGQRIIVSCLATSVASRANPYVKVFDDTGRLIGIQHGYRHGDALVDCTLPKDGPYRIRISEYNYGSGGFDHYYRLQVTTAPWIDAIYPPIVRPGEANEVTIYGRNLPGGKVHPEFKLDGRPVEVLTTKVTPPKSDPRPETRSIPSDNVQTLAGYGFQLSGNGGKSNPYWLTFTDENIVREGANDSAETAQEIPVSCELVGQIEKLDDEDWYALTLKKGQEIRIDLHGQTLGSNADLQWSLRNETDESVLARGDDSPKENTTLFPNATEDPSPVTFGAPEDGRYLLRIISKRAFFAAGPRHFYRLRLSPGAADFQLGARPLQAHQSQGCVLRQGSRQAIQVWVQRSGEFRGEIRLSAKGLPNGVSAEDAVIPPDYHVGNLVLKAEGNAANWDGLIEVWGTAEINGKKIERLAFSGTVRWPNLGLLSPTRLSRTLALSVRSSPIVSLTATLPDNQVIAQGKSLRPSVRVTRLVSEVNRQTIRVYPLSLAPNLSVSSLTYSANRDSQTATLSTRTNTFPGTYSVAFFTQMTVPFTDPKTKMRFNVPMITVSNPVTFTVLPDKLADVKVEANNKVKVGDILKLKVTVDRQYDFAESYKIRLVPSGNTRGLSQVKEGDIAANQNEGILTLRADANTNPGRRSNVEIRVVAMFQGKHEIEQSTRCSIEVEK